MTGDIKKKNRAMEITNLLNEQFRFIAKPPYELKLFPMDVGSELVARSHVLRRC
jgi:hypothetical protein